MISTLQCPSDKTGLIDASPNFSTAAVGSAICNYFGHTGHAGGSPGNPDAPCTQSYYTSYRPFTGNGGFNNGSAGSGTKPNPAGVFARDGNYFRTSDKTYSEQTPVRTATRKQMTDAASAFHAF